jgi:uncharacterized protein YeaO (DUF488 family)
LAGFTKQPDLAFFLRRILGMECVPLPQLAPSKEILRAYQKKGIDWPQYERQFNDLLAGRRVEESVPPALLDKGCLLCSEPKPDRCHRRLAAEYFRSQWRDVDIVHL